MPAAPLRLACSVLSHPGTLTAAPPGTPHDCASGHVAAALGQVCLHISSLAGLTERAGQGNPVNLLYHGSPVTAVNRGGQVQAPSALSSAWAPL